MESTTKAQTRDIERAVIAGVRALEVPLAWPTIALALLVFAGWAATVAAAAAGAMPLWAAFLINAVLTYLSYTPLHDAAHGSIARRRHEWLNHAIGLLPAFIALHNFSLHRVTHLSHHKHLNDPERDADHWVAGQRWWSVLARCSTVFLSHYRIGWRIADRRSKLLGLAENCATLAVAAFVLVTAGWQVLLFAMVLPAIAGMTLLAFLFDYIVHAPYLHEGRFAATRAYILPARWRRIGSALWMQQNYHLAHHLYPWIPFYRYRNVLEVAEPLIERRDGAIIHL
ncbi:fatty acid desaturase [Paraurantiacibacter namhicola]|uniref:Fatty acid desaturase n=1 Tax=Paraurantiacibacter namhicola TaxID=645517 RepID=A0A1C7D6A2_9SPHN|nr:fatty acid desaturase [Paraurantiacibacter namhicola]ANU06882.1 Fatty acid desaturase [Paraurantiacibacter namhicola]